MFEWREKSGGRFDRQPDAMTVDFDPRMEMLRIDRGLARQSVVLIWGSVEATHESAWISDGTQQHGRRRGEQVVWATFGLRESIRRNPRSLLEREPQARTQNADLSQPPIVLPTSRCHRSCGPSNVLPALRTFDDHPILAERFAAILHAAALPDWSTANSCSMDFEANGIAVGVWLHGSQSIAGYSHGRPFEIDHLRSNRRSLLDSNDRCAHG